MEIISKHLQFLRLHITLDLSACTFKNIEFMISLIKKLMNEKEHSLKIKTIKFKLPQRFGDKSLSKFHSSRSRKSVINKHQNIQLDENDIQSIILLNSFILKIKSSKLKSVELELKTCGPMPYEQLSLFSLQYIDFIHIS